MNYYDGRLAMVEAIITTLKNKEFKEMKGKELLNVLMEYKKSAEGNVKFSNNFKFILDDMIPDKEVWVMNDKSKIVAKFNTKQ